VEERERKETWREQARASPEAQDRRSSRKGGGTRYLQAAMMISGNDDVDKRREDG
jgi:hypothetical protein